MALAATGTKRVVFATADAGSFVRLRSALVHEALRRRHKVVVLAAVVEAATGAALERLGATVVAAPFGATGFNPFAGYRIRRDLTGHLRALAPHAIAYCDATAAVALQGPARRAGVPHRVALLASVADAVTAPVHDGLVAALKDATGVVVGTADEQRALAAAPWLERAMPTTVAPTAGVDVRRLGALPLPPLGDGFVFALVAAPDDASARETFTAAATELGRRSAGARFIIADDRVADGAASAAIHSAHVVVHASARDGLTAGLLHALAAGRPLIVSDVAAARDTVDERVNGCRVPAQDAGALVDAMTSFLRRTDLVPAMARASRLKAERRYDVAEVNRITLAALGLDEDFAAAA
jgi:hypothetical protein